MTEYNSTKLDEIEELFKQGFVFSGGEETDDNKGADDKITLEVDGKSVEKTMDELKDLATGALSNDDNTYTLKIDGEDKSFTMDELKAAASESTGAQAKFEEASKIREKAASGARIQELLEGMKGDTTPDKTKVTEFLRLAGIDDANMKDILTNIDSKKENNATRTTKGKKDDEPVGLENLDPRVRAAVEAA